MLQNIEGFPTSQIVALSTTQSPLKPHLMRGISIFLATVEMASTTSTTPSLSYLPLRKGFWPIMAPPHRDHVDPSFTTFDHSPTMRTSS